jgi:ribosomal protein L32E
MTKNQMIRTDGKNMKKLKLKWRAPKGIHNKIKLSNRGHVKGPSIGQSNGKVKNITIINSLKDLENTKEETIILSGKISKKTKMNILEKIVNTKVKIINMRNPQDYLKKLREEFNKKKEVKEEIKEKEIKEKEAKIKEKEAAKKQPKKETAETKKELPEKKEVKEKEVKRKVLEGKGK